ncbi:MULTISPECIES: hypothetical protein [Novosphingobium]|uniref:hypothetical protein n=1 Tax=Novosphingobium sp. ST904 TaxID=1684385 RepID=UPI0006C89176|nr:hypothetical protein [Novosphingobium sp. ST904]KPH67369.1 hypothetical protein ADT71_02375 [Novosphingobium sp. ST904]TCM39273.1 hypothetical protein EDF59_106154 [Novosphingobium sp. ST904]
MSFWTAVVVIFAIASITWLRAQKLRGEKPGFRLDDHSEREHELESEVENLRKRIAVLERIATDDRRERDLAREIDALRD